MSDRERVSDPGRAIDHEPVLRHYRRGRGLVAIESKVPVRDEYMLGLIHTPGAVEACRAIQDDPSLSFSCTIRGNTVAILTDGSSVLSYGDAGPLAALPVIEGKVVLCKALAGIDAFPICATERDPARLADLVRHLAPGFGGFAIEDIASPRSFELLEILEGMSDADLPVPFLFNDMQGACSIVLAALGNALKIVGKKIGGVRAAITGAGGAGLSVARFLRKAGVEEITLCDRHGILWQGRREGMNRFKDAAAGEFNPSGRQGTVRDALKGADLFVGLSGARTVTPDMIRSMARKPIVLALATPVPEIGADEARAAGAAVALTGGADYRHGLNVALAFPGILRGVLEARATRVYDEMLIAAAMAIAGLVPERELEPARLVPRVLDLRVGPAVAEAVAGAAVALGVAGEEIDPASIGERTRQLIYEGEAPMAEHAPAVRVRGDEALDFHRRYRGTIQVRSKVPLKDEHTLQIISTPGVSYVVRAILSDPSRVWEYTVKGNLVAVVTDGSAVQGLGAIAPEAALPVMEGICALLKILAGVEAIPLCLGTRDPDAIVSILKTIEPALGGISLEDIDAPRCYEIERRLRSEIDIPVFHDDLHGTAVVVCAALQNALRLTGRELESASIALCGAGAAGIAVARLLVLAGARDIVVCDRRGALHEGRAGMSAEKESLALVTNRGGTKGSLSQVLRGREVFIGLSGPGLLTAEMIGRMAARSIVFALADPSPEIEPEAAHAVGAAVVATGLADDPNQINKAIAVPGIVRGTLDVAARSVNDAMVLAAVRALADLVPDYELSPRNIVPRPLNFRGAPEVAAAVARAALRSGVARRRVDPRQILENTRDYLYGGTLAALPGEPIEPQPLLPLRP